MFPINVNAQDKKHKPEKEPENTVIMILITMFILNSSQRTPPTFWSLKPSHDDLLLIE